MSDPHASTLKKTRISRQIVLGSYTLLVLAILLNSLSSTIPVIAILPLLIFIPGLIKEYWRAHIWLCFMLLMYFLVTIDALASPLPSIFDYAELVFIVTLFTAAMMYCRWSKQIPPAVGTETDTDSNE